MLLQNDISNHDVYKNALYIAQLTANIWLHINQWNQTCCCCGRCCSWDFIEAAMDAESTTVLRCIENSSTTEPVVDPSKNRRVQSSARLACALSFTCPLVWLTPSSNTYSAINTFFLPFFLALKEDTLSHFSSRKWRSTILCLCTVCWFVCMWSLFCLFRNTFVI